MSTYEFGKDQKQTDLKTFLEKGTGEYSDSHHGPDCSRFNRRHNNASNSFAGQKI